jgi:hypothetical protein
MLEVLEQHLQKGPQRCIVARWIDSLTKEEQSAFSKIMENNKSIQIAILYKDLNEKDQLPFKLTIFRSHLRGYCTCQK